VGRDLDDPRHWELVYRMVMNEGTDDDVRRFIERRRIESEPRTTSG
jgi:hypothetical protein